MFIWQLDQKYIKNIIKIEKEEKEEEEVKEVQEEKRPGIEDWKASSIIYVKAINYLLI